MRPTIFVLTLLLLAGWLEPSRYWMISLVVLAGIDAFRLVPWHPFRLRPRLNMRMAPFVLSTLLLAGAIDPTRGWMIALTAAAGAAMIAPGMLSFGGPDGRDGGCGTSRRRRQVVEDAEAWL